MTPIRFCPERSIRTLPLLSISASRTSAGTPMNVTKMVPIYIRASAAKLREAFAGVIAFPSLAYITCAATVIVWL